MEHLHDLDLESLPVRQIKRSFEPRTRKDYILVISSIVKRPYDQMERLTRHMPNKWFFDIQSECKLKKTEEAKAKFINWFIKESKPKETNLTQI